MLNQLTIFSWEKSIAVTTTLAHSLQQFWTSNKGTVPKVASVKLLLIMDLLQNKRTPC